MFTVKDFRYLVPCGAMLLSAGCFPDLERVEFEQLNTPPLSVTVSPSKLEIPEGIGVAVQASAYDVDGDEADGTMTIDGSGVHVIVREGSEKNQFFLLGRSPGSSTLMVTVTGTEGHVDVPYEITAQ